MVCTAPVSSPVSPSPRQIGQRRRRYRERLQNSRSFSTLRTSLDCGSPTDGDVDQLQGILLPLLSLFSLLRPFMFKFFGGQLLYLNSLLICLPDKSVNDNVIIENMWNMSALPLQPVPATLLPYTLGKTILLLRKT